MELAYLFIKGRVRPTETGHEVLENKPYKVFQNAGFCFSNEFEITYEDETGLVSIVKNQEFVSNFFDNGGKIKSVTSIVGMNGTGKSSVLEFIKSINNYDFSNFPYKFLAVFRIENKRVSPTRNEFVIVRHDALSFNSESKKNLPENCNITTEILTSEISHSGIRIPIHRTIYFSNILEVFRTRFTDVNVDNNQLDDISSTALLNKDAETKTNKYARFSFNDCYHSFGLMECKRHIDFLLHREKYKFTKFNFPSFVEVQADLFYETEVNTTLEGKNFGYITTLFKATEKDQKSLKSKFIFHLHKSVFYYLIRYYTLEAAGSPVDIYKLTNTAFLNNNVSNERIKFLIQSIIDFQTKILMDESTNEKLRMILAVLSYLDKVLDSNFMFGMDLNPVLILNFDENKEFFNNYCSSLFFTGYLNLNWRYTEYSTGDLSSGEKAMLSVFSRFHDLQLEKYQKFTQYNVENLVILIDEGDQLLHPEWQREFLFYLFDFLPKVFLNTKSIQIVLTSHSPFTTSDLPRYCIMYLERSENGITKVVRGKEKEHTMGANIHQLYSDSFYLPNSMMGEFARTEINSLIQELQRESGTLSNEQKNSYLKRAELIGERFLSTKIKEMVNSKMEGANDPN